MENKIYLIFDTTRKVVVAERECKANGFSCLAVPVPREYSSKCGIALEIQSSDEIAILTILGDMGIKPIKYRNDVDGKSCRI